MKQYLAFAGDQYYPSGGMKDFKGDFDTLKEAQVAAGYLDEWQHVYDSVKREIVWAAGCYT